MNTSQVYIAIAMVVLAVAAFVVFFIQKEKKHNKLTPLASLAFGFILFGFFFEEDRLIGYGLLGGRGGTGHHRHGQKSKGWIGLKK